MLKTNKEMYDALMKHEALKESKGKEESVKVEGVTYKLNWSVEEREYNDEVTLKEVVLHCVGSNGFTISIVVPDRLASMVFDNMKQYKWFLDGYVVTEITSAMSFTES